MKIQELRIGSILTYNGVNVKVEVINNEIGEVYVWGDDFYYNVELENLKPIPLTEEWLLKFGFVKDNNGNYWIDLKTNYLTFINSESYWYPVYNQIPEMSSEDEQSVSLNRINHVHQLQNLYFVLTGQELCEAR